ncbi:MAG: FtsX-like permease family protein [Rhizobiaceae bacterium]
MTAFLQSIMGRLPIGWLQLSYSKTRLAAAIAGVSFANILVFVQLGLLGSMNASIIKSYNVFDADIMISATDANTMTEGGNVARQWMFQALSFDEVISGAPLFVGIAMWSSPTGDTALQTFGVDPIRVDFLAPSIAKTVTNLTLLDTAVMDRKARGLTPEVAAGIRPHSPYRFETAGRTLTVTQTFEGGAGFAADGYMFVSDQTFLRLFGKRKSGAPNHILLKVAPNASVAEVVTKLKTVLPVDQLRIRSFMDAAREDQKYQMTQKPVGLIFGFGVVIGVLVGIVIVYQVLSTDVADHLSEYATFKAMGYGQSFFLSVVFEEAIILAVLGFGPGILISMAMYKFLAAMTFLPLQMTIATALMVFFGTLAACSISGAIATRRLVGADPADLF